MSYREEWKEIKLGDLVEIKHGYAFKGVFITKELTQNILVTPGNFNIGGGFKSTKFKYYNGQIPQDYILNKDDVIVTMTDLSKAGDTLGYSAKVPYKKGYTYLHNQRIGLVVFKQKELQSKDYIYWLLRTKPYQKFIVNTATGTSVKHTSPTRIYEYKFNLPPLPTQKSIASILSAFDEKIEVNRAMNVTLEAMAQAMFRKMCLPEDEKQLEKGWSSEILENHTKIDRGLSYKGAGLTNAEDEKGLPMHNLNSVFEGGGYKFKGIKFYNGKYKERHLIEAGDIIVTNTEQGHKYLLIGCPAIIPSYFGKKGIFSQHIYKILPKENSSITRPFLYYLLTQKMVREQVISCTNGTTVNMLSKDGLQMPQFFLPPKSIIQKFTEFVEPIIQQKEALYKENQELSKTRDMLLPKLMSGEIEV